MQRPAKAAPNVLFMLLLPWIHGPRKLQTETLTEIQCVSPSVSPQRCQTSFLWYILTSSLAKKIKGAGEVIQSLPLRSTCSRAQIWKMSSKCCESHSPVVNFGCDSAPLLWPGLKHRCNLCIFLWLRGSRQGRLSRIDTWI